MIMTQKNFAVSVLIMLLALCIGTPVRAEKGWIDVTDKYLKNPGFDGNSNAYWTYTSDAHSQTVRCEAMEFWNGTWDLYQVISNLPTTLLYAPFTTDWATLLVATDIAGMGTPIASLASLIAFRLYMHTRGARAASFAKEFAIVNTLMLAAMVILYAALFVRW